MSNRDRRNRQTPRQSMVASFRCAFTGIFTVVRDEPNILRQGAVAVVIVGMGFWLGITRVEFAILGVMMGLVLTAEMLNTAIEHAVDVATDEISEPARLAKDVAAGAVLTAAIVAVVVGLIILGPPLADMLT